MTNQTRLAAFGAILGMFLAAPASRAQGPYCSNATMNGTYVLTATGTVTTPAGPVAFTVIGKVTYFGDGTGSLTFSTSSTGGTVSRISGPVPGTYTVKSDCTGSKVFGGVQHYDFVIAPDGRVITWIVTDAGVSVSGQAVRMDGQS